MEVVLIKKEDNYIELSPQPFRYISKFPLQTQTNKGGSGLTFRYKRRKPRFGALFYSTSIYFATTLSFYAIE